MALLIETQPVPLTMNADGVVRVSNTRVTLDTVIAAFQEGATAEEIVHQYPSLGLPDVYSVIGYYLKNRYEVDKYLQVRGKKERVVREQAEAGYHTNLVRERLMKRKPKTKMEIQHYKFNRITFDPAKCFGKPCIRGMRLPIASILSYLGSGMTVEAVLKEWPELESEDISQALGYAAWAMEERVLTVQAAA
jgi:uncharacterized protein (DUF433 family)